MVKADVDFTMNPQFYWTSRELEKAMSLIVRKKWDTVRVGAKLEAFAVAGATIESEFFLPGD